MKSIFISWEKYHARTQLLAEAVGARIFYISRLGRGGGPRLLLKYFVQSLETLVVLLRERPDAIFVQTPPVFAAQVAVIYAALFRKGRVFIDAHSGNFFSLKWRWSLPLHRWASRRAALTIVHMRSLLPVVQGWNAPAMEMGYCFGEVPPIGAAYSLRPGFNVVCPTSFNEDEPLDLILRAAELLPDVRFHLTGNSSRLPASVQQASPPNVVFTGYLAREDFYGLLHAADCILALTTQDQTFQTGGAEAVWLSRPLVLSDWPELRQVFPAAVFVANRPEAIAGGIEAARANSASLEAAIRRLKHDFDRGRSARLRWLRSVINQDVPALRPQVGDWAAEKEKS
jgi:glycosyltransferase involved in cell wall biosynthesis